jgi:hypothetical protein
MTTQQTEPPWSSGRLAKQWAPREPAMWAMPAMWAGRESTARGRATPLMWARGQDAQASAMAPVLASGLTAKAMAAWVMRSVRAMTAGPVSGPVQARALVRVS